MKRGFYALLVCCLAFSFSTRLFAHKGKTCETCFTSQITKSTAKGDQCTEYEIVVSYEGKCKYALSSFIVSLPPCATIRNALHTSSCGHSLQYDRLTGLTGLVLDDLHNFGKSYAKSFKVTLTVCGKAACSSFKNWDPIVAYVTGDCFELDTLRTNAPPTPVNPLQASIEKTDATCNGKTDGTATVTVTKGTPPYRYLWSTSANTNVIQGLVAGTYNVSIADADNNTLNLSVVVGQPPAIVVTANISSSTCAGLSTGAIDLTVSGGTGNYSYLWSNGATTEDIATLKAGSYSVTVKDAAGCSTTAIYAVANSKQLQVSAEIQQPGCSQSNGSISLLVTGGTTPYTYLWSNGATSAALTGMPQGTYNVNVLDAAGCSTSGAYALRENNTLRVSFMVTPTTCLDDHSGAINVSMTGGTPPYAYSWSNGATTEDLSGVAGGVYKLTVTDAVGCQTVSNISVFKNTFLVNSSIVQPQCFGDNTTGSVLLIPSGGLEPYSYLWSTGATTAAVTGLVPGTYTVTVEDATGCSKLLVYSIASPTQIKATHAVSITSCGSYAINLSVTGGAQPFQFTWSNGSHTQNLANVPEGTYTVSIADANGCTLSHETVIEATSGWTCLIVPPIAPPTCRSTGNLVTTSILNATSYQWELTSDDGSWAIQSGSTTGTLLYSAGKENTTATFTLTLVKDGCTQTCSYLLGACQTGSLPPDNSPGHTACSYPNPFRDWCDFDVTCDDDDDIEIEIFDQYGKRACEPIACHFSRGEKRTFRIDGSLLHDRLYIYRVKGKHKSSYGKICKAN